MPAVKRPLVAALLTLVTSLAATTARAADDVGISWETEALPNGLKVIYAPMPSSPVTQVRVDYHVGSRDEQPDRQGFAHMFEHMMFRGSAHVVPQQHMKMVGSVGGYCNAFTAFDKTEYHDTLPSSYANMALWLEADRMSSFKVSPQIFHTERLVVAEEWRMRQNQPYGTMWDTLFAQVYKEAPYHWTPIGNMQHLQAAQTSELQAFFNKYYVPSNAVLVIAGKMDVAETKEAVHKYFGWIPQGAELDRHVVKEPEQTEPRREEVKMRVPLPRLVITYPMPPLVSDDQDALGLLMTILGDGRSSRLSRVLVTNADPLCISAESMAEPLEDGGIMGVEATLMQGKDPAAVEKVMLEQIKQITDNPVTPEELEKAKQQERLALATRWETPDSTATILGDEMMMRGNLEHVKTERARMEALTAADLQRVARKYFVATKTSTLTIVPGKPTPAATQAAASQAATEPVAQAAPRKVDFPADYPTRAPMSGTIPHATFEKGVEKNIDGVRVIVMEDHRIPIVNWSLTTRMGSHAEPVGKEGLAGLTAGMVRRGPAGKTYDEFNEELESRGISIEVSDGGDITTINGSSLKEQLPYGLDATRSLLQKPAFDPAQFENLKHESLDHLRLALNTPTKLASREFAHAMYGDSPLGRRDTIESLTAITLDDVKKFYNDVYSSKDAILMIAGDVTVEEGQKAAETLLAESRSNDLPKVEYHLPAAPDKRRVLLVDFPPSKQSTIQLGEPSFTIASDEKFAGTLAGQLLSAGIDSRLGKYVRAEKGYVYGISAMFEPGRQAGDFNGSTGTKFETTADTVEAMFKVFDDMKTAPVPEDELNEAKKRIAGQMLMSMQTIQQQASRRATAILNGYPIDYYDVYPERISKVTADDVKTVMSTYADENKMTIVVVAPASAVKSQLEKVGDVTVITSGSQE
ncbi:MAG TPA: pitrilysin family protein [Phycisphaerae bacterium]|nr:pitrilysin family protein [Phycisphaerae bacterium]